jgi:tetrahydromethanopterin S-methyltransferase subunit F
MAEESTQAGPVRMVAIQNMVSAVQYKGQILARTNKLESGILSSGLVGFAAGVAVAMVLVLVPALLM